MKYTKAEMELIEFEDGILTDVIQTSDDQGDINLGED